MTISRNVNPTPQFFDSSGDLLVNGKMFYFESGTNTPKTTFSDVNQTIPNSNPVILTGDARLPNVFFSGSVKQILTDKDDIQYWSRDPVTSADSSSFGANWNAITTFSKNEVVSFNDVLYVSIIDFNQNNNPGTTPTAWTQFDLVKRWNVNETYGLSDPVIASDFNIYISTSSSNTGNDPTENLSVWSASGNIFRGALAYPSVTQSIPNSITTTLNFDSEEYDTDSFHDNSVNNSRLTIPSGVSRVRVFAQATFDANATGIRRVSIISNISSQISFTTSNVNALVIFSTSINIVSPVIDVSSGDFFQLTVLQTSGGNLDTLGLSLGSSSTFLSIEVIE